MSMSPRRIEAAMSEAMQRIAMVDDADDRARLEALAAGDADIFNVLDRLAENAIADKLLAELADGRADRLAERSERARDIIRRILEVLDLPSIERPTYTATMAEGPKSVVVQNEGAVPDHYIRHAPNKPEILRALKRGEDVPGCTMNNGAPVLRLLTR